MRILQATVANDKGGLTGYIVNNYRRIDKTKFQFDFITYDEKLDFQEEVKGLGGNIYRFPRPTHIIQYYCRLHEIYHRKKYCILHLHMSYANVVPILLAKLVGFPRIIIHSHSTGLDDPSTLIRFGKLFMHKIGRSLLPYLATDYLACSKMAARWMFPSSIIKKNQYHIMYNAIDLEKFRYNKKVRNVVRQRLNIPDQCYVIGHVGRFTYQKNHEFLINVFYELQKNDEQTLLLLIGDGPERNKIETQVREYGLLKKVLFLGQRSDISELYQAMDVMVLPSRFEGLCIVAIEAQMAGLPCVCSEALPEETKVSSDFTYKSLSDSPKEWASAILKKKGEMRLDATESLKRAGYDANTEIKRMEQIYQYTL